MKEKDLDTRFMEAYAIASSMSQSDLTQDTQLRLYAYFKQGKGIGPAQQNSTIDLRNAFKANAWMQISHMSAKEAKKAYIELVEEISNGLI